MLGENLKALRSRRGVTQKMLAESIDVTPAHISAMKNGVKIPSAAQVAVFAEVLGCTTDAIILGTGLELAQEKELIEKFRAASPEKRKAERAALENRGVGA